MKFFVIIGNNALYTYERDGQQFKPQYIEGSASYAISFVNIGEDVNSYMEILANEKKIIKVILNNNKYVFLYDINITNYTVTGTDRHNEKWVFPKSEIKEICLEKENENEKNNT